MRVLTSLADPRIGGPQLQSLSVAEGLRGHGIETVFHVPGDEDAFERLASAAGFEVVRPGPTRLHPPRDVVGNTRFLAGLAPAVRGLATAIRRLRIDVVHAGMTLAAPAALAARLAKTPLVWYFNDTGTPWPLNRVVGRLARTTADEIAIAADAVKDHFFGQSVPTRTIYSPVDTAEFDPNSVDAEGQSVREELGVDADVPIVGTVANINPVKGYEYLLPAIARVRDRIGPLVVPIVGTALESRESYFDHLRALRAELELEETVRFLGYRSDVPRLLSAFDVFVLSSVSEACPISVLEAMAMRKAIVATRVGGVPEQLVDGTHGWVVPPGEPDALATAIVEALESPTERRRRGTAARDRAERRFSVERCVDRHRDLFETARSTGAADTDRVRAGYDR